jgi:hypothetical protein
VRSLSKPLVGSIRTKDEKRTVLRVSRGSAHPGTALVRSSLLFDCTRADTTPQFSGSPIVEPDPQG